MQTAANPPAGSDADREIVVTRVLDFPRERVFAAWTDPRHVGEWWGPDGFATTTLAWDFAPGGQWRYTMHGPDGVDWPNDIRYTRIVPGRHLAYEHGDDTPGAAPWFRVTVDFIDEGAGTRLTMRLVFDSAEKCAETKKHGAVDGGRQTLARFDRHLAALASDTAAATEEVFICTRELAAPPERVFAAWTEPDRLLQWFGPVGMQLENLRFDLRPGGEYHYAMHAADGSFTMYGLWRFVEIVRPVRLVIEQSFADAEGRRTPPPFPGDWPASWTTTVTFAPRDGRTRLTLRSSPAGATAAQRRFFRDMHASMQNGWGGTLDALGRHLALD